MASRHCDVCNLWHDLGEPWPEACLGHYRKRKDQDAHYVMGDIQPYKSTRGEVIQGRKQHRDYLKAHNLVEIGNEYEAATKREEKPPPPVEKTIQRAFHAIEQGYRPRPMTRQEFNS